MTIYTYLRFADFFFLLVKTFWRRWFRRIECTRHCREKQSIARVAYRSQGSLDRAVQIKNISDGKNIIRSSSQPLWPKIQYWTIVYTYLAGCVERFLWTTRFCDTQRIPLWTHKNTRIHLLYSYYIGRKFLRPASALHYRR